MGHIKPMGPRGPSGRTAGGRTVDGRRRAEPPEHTSEQQDGSKPYSNSRVPYLKGFYKASIKDFLVSP